MNSHPLRTLDIATVCACGRPVAVYLRPKRPAVGRLVVRGIDLCAFCRAIPLPGDMRRVSIVEAVEAVGKVA